MCEYPLAYLNGEYNETNPQKLSKRIPYSRKHPPQLFRLYFHPWELRKYDRRLGLNTNKYRVIV